MSKFIDEVPITVIAGHGGPGAVSFRHEKFAEFGGPDGGEGGYGGNVILKSDLNLQTLDKFIPLKHYSAGASSHGEGKNRSGKKGEDIILKVPVGTQVTDIETEDVLFDFVKEDLEYIAAKGGRGGKGNAFFKSSTHQAPRFAQDGEEGESKDILLTLKLLADVGLVGLPNAGKSTLLSRITHAHPKIASYAFTTLSPNLGVVDREDSFRRYTIADIPGIIEGASKGHGLGLSFLRHVERVTGIIYMFDATSLDIEEEYKMLQNELKTYSKTLVKKKSIVVLNKSDLVDDQDFLQEMVKNLKIKEEIICISAEKGTGLDILLNAIDRVFFGAKKRKKSEAKKI